MRSRLQCDYSMAVLLLAAFFGTALFILAAFEVGLRFGRWREQQPDPEPPLPARMIISSLLSLLAFLLAFIFGISASHYDSRNEALHAEAIAIGAAYHRTDLLAERERARLRNLIREYVDLRVQASRSTNVEQVIQRLRELQERMWTTAMEKNESGGMPPTLLLQSLSEMIDVHSDRVLANMQARIPPFAWFFLFAIIGISMAAAGYHSGLAGNRRRSFAALAYALAFAAVIVLIVDADTPQAGSFRACHQVLVDLQARLSTTEP